MESTRGVGAKEASPVDKLRLVEYYLGVAFNQMKDKTFLLQWAYCSCILRQFGMEMAKTAFAPMAHNVKKLFP